jgi:hypothetical protein
MKGAVNELTTSTGTPINALYVGELPKRKITCRLCKPQVKGPNPFVGFLLKCLPLNSLYRPPLEEKSTVCGWGRKNNIQYPTLDTQHPSGREGLRPYCKLQKLNFKYQNGFGKGEKIFDTD